MSQAAPRSSVEACLWTLRLLAALWAVAAVCSGVCPEQLGLQIHWVGHLRINTHHAVYHRHLLLHRRCRPAAEGSTLLVRCCSDHCPASNWRVLSLESRD